MNDLPNPLEAKKSGTRILVQPENRFDRIVVRSSEWLNPILVRECRRALKSNQFVTTSGLLLVAALAWSFIGLNHYRNIEMGEGTIDFMTGYFWILLVPLLLIVPVYTFLAIESERTGNLSDLVSLTTMRPSQIILGKVGSALMQVIIYVSMLMPFICFTYLLRGIAPSYLLIGLVFSIVVSFCLISLATLFATAPISRSLRIITLLIFTGIVAFAYFGVGASLSEIQGISRHLFYQNDSVPVIGASMMIVSYAPICLTTAISQMTFRADNRSTMVRVALLLQQGLLLAWLYSTFYLVIDVEFFTYVLAFCAIATIHWIVIAAIMIGEKPEISRRVRRSYPRFFGLRAIWAWMFPGPFRGMMFCLCNVWVIALFFAWLLYFSPFRSEMTAMVGPGRGGARILNSIMMSVVCIGFYVTIYVCLTAIIVRLFRIRLSIGPIFSLAIMVGLIGVITIWSYQLLALQDQRDLQFNTRVIPVGPTIAEFMCVPKMLEYTVRGIFSAYDCFPIFATAASLLLIVIVLGWKELSAVRVKMPERVRQDNLEHQDKVVPFDILTD